MGRVSDSRPKRFLRFWAYVAVAVFLAHNPSQAFLKMESFSETKRPAVCVCLDVTNLLCGSDGITYQNKCMADCHNVQVYARGPCKFFLKESPKQSLDSR
ncbi:hypothetical protein O6H91_15G055300 [Diphasiastrum complanatum]|uniref:Uncharacterized protein n=2 Tax=Diphasiastrum complanatum TaxID=34168 RepID=A0ACC2BIG0_DIPCM|nr:hypothetical protein O6H91_15G053900 [Diphasiastrum complanatum]KAJ7529530.1 hypothetical protein O6H91_15G055300 [Diphasiastrum complanatum]